MDSMEEYYLDMDWLVDYSTLLGLFCWCMDRLVESPSSSWHMDWMEPSCWHHWMEECCFDTVWLVPMDDEESSFEQPSFVPVAEVLALNQQIAIRLYHPVLLVPVEVILDHPVLVDLEMEG